jgi:uncharacterized protein
MNRIPTAALLILLRGYKRMISPMFPPACRFVPTCSEFAMEAIERHGALRGVAMAIRRLARCHPFARGGFDPVPTNATSLKRTARVEADICPTATHSLPANESHA